MAVDIVDFFANAKAAQSKQAAKTQLTNLKQGVQTSANQLKLQISAHNQSVTQVTNSNVTDEHKAVVLFHLQGIIAFKEQCIAVAEAEVAAIDDAIAAL